MFLLSFSKVITQMITKGMTFVNYKNYDFDFAKALFLL